MSLATTVQVAGAASFVAWLFLSLVSFGVSGTGGSRPGAPVYHEIAALISVFGEGFREFALGRNAMQDPWIRRLVLGIPTFAITAATLWAMRAIRRARVELPDDLPEVIFRWSVAFAFAATISVPLLEEDVWLGPAWGQMVVEGRNPYYEPLTPELGTGWSGVTMTYGPGFALLAGGVMTLAGGEPLLGYSIFKLLQLASWCGILLLLRRILRGRAIHEQALGLLVVGWLPLGVGNALMEGHNDVYLALLVLAWLATAGLRRGLGLVLLTASALFKYVSAPLVALDVVRWLREGRPRPRRYLGIALLCVGLACLVFSPFFRSLEMFDSAEQMRSAHYMRPGDSLRGIGELLGAPPALVEAGAYAVHGLFFVFCGLALRRYLRSATSQHFQELVLTTLAAMLLVVVGHVHAWFNLWILPLVAICPRPGISRFLVGTIVLTPFAWLLLGAVPRWSIYGIVFPAVHVGGLAWMIWGPRVSPMYPDVSSENALADPS